MVEASDDDDDDDDEDEDEDEDKEDEFCWTTNPFSFTERAVTGDA